MIRTLRRQARLATTFADGRRLIPRHVRQRITTWAFLIATMAIAQFINVPQLVAESADRPNIIFILADDLGYGDLGCFGQKKIKTPHLDQMAAEGMKLTSFYAGSTVCAPSRCVLMTGLHTGHCRVRGNGQPGAQSLSEESRTVASFLKENGYETALIGKWGLGDPELGVAGLPTNQGFDDFFGYINQRHAHNYYPEILWRNTEKVRLRNVVNKVSEAEWGAAGWATKRVDYSHDLFMDETLAFLQGKHEQPFFLYLALTIPHANNEGTRGTGNGQEVPDYGIYEQTDWTEPNKGQAAMITRMDAGIGRMFATLKERGVDDDTLVIFTSDNGHHREGGNDPEFFDANGPLRGMKRALYEGGIRVPTIARWPGRIPAGSTSDHPAYFGDFFATVADILGQPVPSGLDSISVLPALTGNSEDQQEHPYLYWEFYELGSRQAARFGNWKAIREPMIDGKVQLYDLAADLGEQNDLAKSHPELVEKAAAIMDEAHEPSPLWKIRK